MSEAIAPAGGFTPPTTGLDAWGVPSPGAEALRQSEAPAGEEARRAADSGPRRLAPELAEAPSTVVDALKTWRLAEARRRRVPAFRVLTDKALLGIAVLRPRSSDGLSEVQGVGPKAIQSYGAAIIEVVSKAEGKRG